jgi:hypothetical protein
MAGGHIDRSQHIASRITTGISSRPDDWVPHPSRFFAKGWNKDPMDNPVLLEHGRGKGNSEVSMTAVRG